MRADRHAERDPERGVHRYHKIRPDGEAIERLFVELFLEAYRKPPAEIVLDLERRNEPIQLNSIID